MKMIDLHTHCLPGIDDGAQSVAESLCMLSDSFEQGVELCVATPHCVLHQPDSLSDFLREREQSFAALTGAVKESEMELPGLLLGAEVYFDHDISEHSELKKLCIGTTDFLLLEFSRSGISAQVFEWLYSLTVRGIRPVIAHIDRYPQWEFLMDGCAGLDIVYQVNADNFLSFMGRRLMKSLIQKGHPYIVCSDMHNMKERRSQMQKACRKAGKMFPQHIVDGMFAENAKRLLDI